MDCEVADMKLKGRCAIVTGASNGIGRAIAFALAAEGANVAVGYYSNPGKAADVAEEIKTKYHVDAITFQADIANLDDIERMIEDTVTAFGRLDILVNNAGARDQAPLSEVTPGLWEHAVNSNLKGILWGIRKAAPYMEKQGKGSIINISSAQGIRPCNLSRTCYCSTKRGLLSLTAAAAAELGPKNIRVNAISPGTIETDMGGLKGQFTPELIAERCKHIPLRYRGKPEEVALPAVFLASDDSSYITGINLPVDGGWCEVD